MTTESQFGQMTGEGMDRRYVTKPGDTLEDLAAYFYGDAQHRQRIIEENPDFANVSPGETLPAGTTLSVTHDPSKGDTEFNPSA